MLLKCVTFSEAAEKKKEHLERGSAESPKLHIAALECKGPAVVGRDTSDPITTFQCTLFLYYYYLSSCCYSH